MEEVGGRDGEKNDRYKLEKDRYKFEKHRCKLGKGRCKFATASGNLRSPSGERSRAEADRLPPKAKIGLGGLVSLPRRGESQDDNCWIVQTQWGLVPAIKKGN